MSKKLGFFLRVEAKAGKEKDVENLFTSAVQLAMEEGDTLTWYAFRFNHSTFGIFDTFQNEEGRQAHLNGKIAQALMANAAELLAAAPKFEPIDILAAK